MTLLDRAAEKLPVFDLSQAAQSENDDQRRAARRHLVLVVARVILSEPCTIDELNAALDEKQGSSEDMYRRIFRGIAKQRLAELEGT